MNNGQSAAEKIFKDIPGFEEYYSISEDGDVYSKRNNRILKPNKSKSGYLKIGLNVNKKTYYYRIHRLVAMTFLDNKNNFPEVNHKDYNTLNNHFTNLE